MTISIKTSELQDMVGKVIKCVSNNRLIPLTSLMNIKVKDNYLTLTTTDATNYFYVSKDEKIDCEDIEVSVVADLFTKLVQKTTCETITITVENNLVKIKGNGNYTMELPLDENGMPIKFPNKLNDDFRTDAGIIKLSTVKNILAVNKASLAANMQLPVLTCYYCGDQVVTSDKKKICCNNIKVFEKPMLISANLMELLGTVGEENILVTTTDTDVVFRTKNDIIYSPIVVGIETFPVAAINNLVNQEFNSFCKVSRAEVLNVIDRLSLFVDTYDKHGIYLTFTQNGIMFSSKKSSGQELIPFAESDNFSAYSCCIDIEMLKSQIMTIDNEYLELWYGSPVAVKLVCNNIVQLIALIDDDRTEA